ncbi:hypothetical protein NA57DRAFT_72399 [Rhizodiscina lignyota]|uniref:Gfd2/YDR514C-like C-terminal domain-containing protein n=1 Tax=Rhizodiscina lignyota TaxID=1504668 RepID=A0A9P4MA14_9PEZI|nr:hypothetical protein NA57DRAFT_72399 [Rhizodiscina lignyota]
MDSARTPSQMHCGHLPVQMPSVNKSSYLNRKRVGSVDDVADIIDELCSNRKADSSCDPIIISLHTVGGGSPGGPTEIGISLLDSRTLKGSLPSHQHPLVTTYNYTLRSREDVSRAQKRVLPGGMCRTIRTYVSQLLGHVFHYGLSGEASPCGCKTFRSFEPRGSGEGNHCGPTDQALSIDLRYITSRPIILVGHAIHNHIAALTSTGWDPTDVLISAIIDTQQIAAFPYGNGISLDNLLHRLDIFPLKMQQHRPADDATFTFIAALRLAAKEMRGENRQKISDIVDRSNEIKE